MGFIDIDIPNGCKAQRCITHHALQYKIQCEWYFPDEEGADTLKPNYELKGEYVIEYIAPEIVLTPEKLGQEVMSLIGLETLPVDYFIAIQGAKEYSTVSFWGPIKEHDSTTTCSFGGWKVLAGHTPVGLDEGAEYQLVPILEANGPIDAEIPFRFAAEIRQIDEDGRSWLSEDTVLWKSFSRITIITSESGTRLIGRPIMVPRFSTPGMKALRVTLINRYGVPVERTTASFAIEVT